MTTPTPRAKTGYSGKYEVLGDVELSPEEVYTNRSPVLQVLEAARQELSNPARWVKGAYVSVDGALSIGGNYSLTYPYDIPREHITGMCALGAVLLSARWQGRHSMVALAAERILIQTLKLDVHTPLSCWNDAPERTHQEVLAAFDKAIQTAKDMA